VIEMDNTKPVTDAHETAIENMSSEDAARWNRIGLLTYKLEKVLNREKDFEIAVYAAVQLVSLLILNEAEDPPAMARWSADRLTSIVDMCLRMEAEQATKQ
jgi:hypothetical protein